MDATELSFLSARDVLARFRDKSLSFAQGTEGFFHQLNRLLYRTEFRNERIGQDLHH